MWEYSEPQRVKLIIGILASDRKCLDRAVEYVRQRIGAIDMLSDAWDFTQTTYYRDEMGDEVLRQFVSIERTIAPGRLAKLKRKTNKMEQELAEELQSEHRRPVNFDPGIIEPSKLVLATTKNFSHRIYIGKKIWAELTLMFDKGKWKTFDYTYPDYREPKYHDFFNKVRERLVVQLREQ